MMTAHRSATGDAMGTRDARVDAYIARSADFAHGILAHLRDLVHTACPQVTETIKWGHPHFEYKGILCGMAAFKAHCAFGFWRREVVTAAAGEPRARAMGQFGRIARLSDLPRDTVLKEAIRHAAARNEAGAGATQHARKVRKPPPVVPEDLAAALAKNARARSTFEAFSPSHRREYIEWIDGAKQDQTRARRLATAIEWLEQGRTREWRYQRAKAGPAR
jgi:uncharacterized protein YdeI (YjbR/CyaY-like superfamily)